MTRPTCLVRRAASWSAAVLGTAMLLVVAALPIAAPAHAGVYTSFTTFSWSGKPCVDFESPLIGNASVCDGNGQFGFHQINETVVQSGQWIGARIPLSDQRKVGCTVWLGPVGGLSSVYANDEADASLGAGEANCLRRVP